METIKRNEDSSWKGSSYHSSGLIVTSWWLKNSLWERTGKKWNSRTNAREGESKANQLFRVEMIIGF